MQVAFYILAFVALLMTVVAIAIMAGKGDDFIVGYNLASRKTRELYHTWRVRIIAGITILIIAAMLPWIAFLLIRGYNEMVKSIIPASAFVLFFGVFFAVHFWARKKDVR